MSTFQENSKISKNIFYLVNKMSDFNGDKMDRNAPEFNCSNKEKEKEIENAANQTSTEKVGIKNAFEISNLFCDTPMLNKHSVEAIVNSPKKRKNVESGLFENGFDVIEKCSNEKKRKYSNIETDILSSVKSR